VTAELIFRAFYALTATSFLLYGVWLVVRPIQATAHFVGRDSEQAKTMLSDPRLPLIARIIGVSFIILAALLVLPGN
jgi:hypothetical protein